MPCLQTEGWIYSIWDNHSSTYRQNLSYDEAIDVLVGIGFTEEWSMTFLERVGGPEDLALEVAGVVGMNVTDLTGDPA